MSGGEFDPVLFGQLIAEVKHTSEKMDSTMEKMDKFIDATEARFGSIAADAATKKGMLIGALSGGALGGASLAEFVKHWFK
jgi:hypothetical protein